MAELERENVKLKRVLSQQFARVPVLESLVQDLQALSSRFVSVADVEPTNNLVERAIRPAVLWRNGSFATDSESGSRFVERIRPAVTTLRL